jgi:hypothetical protein
MDRIQHPNTLDPLDHQILRRVADDAKASAPFTLGLGGDGEVRCGWFTPAEALIMATHTHADPY